MTVLPWPADLFSRRPKTAGKLMVDPLPTAVLHQMVADLPGPKNETEEQRAARFRTQLAEVLSYNPRNSADAMLATQCIMLRMLSEDCTRDASRPHHSRAAAKQILRTAKQFDQLFGDMLRQLAQRQEHPLQKLDPAVFAAMGLEQFLVPDPDDPDAPEEAFSAIIVPLHPAPKSLQ